MNASRSMRTRRYGAGRWPRRLPRAACRSTCAAAAGVSAGVANWTCARAASRCKGVWSRRRRRCRPARRGLPDRRRSIFPPARASCTGRSWARPLRFASPTGTTPFSRRRGARHGICRRCGDDDGRLAAGGPGCGRSVGADERVQCAVEIWRQCDRAHRCRPRPKPPRAHAAGHRGRNDCPVAGARACAAAGRSASRIAGGTVAGNMTMLHLLAGQDPRRWARRRSPPVSCPANALMRAGSV